MTTRISIPTFLGGISQQSHGQRQPNLVDDALNVEFLATEGSTKRYPTEHVARLTVGDMTGSKLLTLERDDAEYAVLINDTEVKVWNLDGTAATVTAPGGGAADFSYLAGASETDIRTQSYADTTFVLNRAQVAAGAAGTVSPSWVEDGEGTLFVRAGNFGVKYTVRVKTTSMAAEEIIEYTVPIEPQLQVLGIYGNNSTAYYENTSITENQARGIDPFYTWGGPGLGFQFQAPANLKFRINGASPDESGRLLRGDSINQAVYWEGPYAGASAPNTLATGDRVEIVPLAHNFSWWTQTNSIINALRKRLVLQVPTLSIETAEGESTIRIYTTAPGEAIEVLEVTDSQGGNFLVGYRGEIDKFNDLPLVGKHGQVVRIVGLTADTADDHYVRFATTEWAEETDRDFDQFTSYSGFGPGSWLETTQPDQATGAISGATMPHQLSRVDATNFTWGPIDWAIRDAGDDESNEVPSFIGESIRDIYWHQNRLGFLAQNSVILSESGEQFNFWRTTVLSLPDSDPIDIDAADLDGDVLNHAVAFNDRLIVFSREAQAAVFGQPVLSPSSVSAPVISRYRSFTNVDPVLSGQSLFFGYSSGQYSQFREYIPTQQQDQFIDTIITAAAPKLIPSDVRRLTKASVDQQLAVLVESDRSAVYLYQYYRQGQDLLQASWTRWSFTGDIVDISFVQDRMVLAMVRDGDTYLETMQLGVGRTESTGEAVSRLDRRTVSLVGTYDRGTDETEFVLPYSFDDAAPMTLTAVGGGDYPAGSEFVPSSTVGASSILRVNGDVEAQAMVAGETYNSFLELSRPYMKQDADRGASQILGSAQTVRGLHVALTNTAYLRAEISYVGSPGAAEEYLTDLLDVGNLEPGLTREGELRVGIHARVDEFSVKLINDTAAPSTITSGAWDIRLNTRYRLG
jgi:hypothetical protein